MILILMILFLSFPYYKFSCFKFGFAKYLYFLYTQVKFSVFSMCKIRRLPHAYYSKMKEVQRVWKLQILC